MHILVNIANVVQVVTNADITVLGFSRYVALVGITIDLIGGEFDMSETKKTCANCAHKNIAMRYDPCRECMRTRQKWQPDGILWPVKRLRSKVVLGAN